MPNYDDFEERSEQEILRDKLIKRRKQKREAMRDTGNSGLSMNSMMDMMTIILVFLLKSYGEEPVRILPGMDVPYSVAEVNPVDMTVISITKKSVSLLNKDIVPIEDGEIAANYKKGGSGGYIIEPLENALQDELEKQKNVARMKGVEFKGDVTIVADESTNYQLLTSVMQTALSNEFSKFRFAVIKSSMGQSGLYSKALDSLKIHK